MGNATKMYLAEFIGTFALVLIGCGSIEIGGLGGALGAAGTGALALLPIALAFGMTVTAMAYGIGPISGCHINPAVSVGAWVAGRLDTASLIGYIVAQVAGAIVGALVLSLILGGSAHLGETTLGPNISSGIGFLVEFIATFLFLVVILGSTSSGAGAAGPVAGLAIGLALTVCHLAFIKATGSSLNPARSIGPALFVGGNAMAQIWIYILAPIAGGAVAGLLFKTKALEV